MTRAALLLVFVCLPLGTAPIEISTGLALALALWRRALPQELLGPVLLIGLGLLASALGRGGAALLEALGRTWPLALALAVPALTAAVPDAERARAVAWGLATAAAAVVVSLAMAAGFGLPAQWPFSHHLTLGYALLSPLAAALALRRWGVAALLGLGIAATVSSGPALGAAVVIAALWARPRVALAGGVVVSLVVIGLLTADAELGQRAVLWSSGAAIALENPLGVGPDGFRRAAAIAQDQLSPGFHFPLHAHDAALQRAAVSGLGAWVGWAWLLVVLWRRADRAGRAAIAGTVVGGLTQDTLGDLEVVRALCAWSLIGVQPESAGVVSTDNAEASGEGRT